MNSIRITLLKELRTIFRDKKTFRSLFLLPLFIPLFIILYGYIFDEMDKDVESKTNIGVNFKVDSEADKLYEELLIEDKYYDSEEKLEEAYNNKEISAYIVFDEKENKYYMHANSSDQEGSISGDKAISFLEAYNKYLAINYLNENNMDINKVYANVNYEIIEISSENYLLKLILSIAITYTILSIVMAATNMAISSTVTEKENGTLETILTLPIKSDQLIVGKLLASTVMGIIVSVFSFTLTYSSVIIGSKSFESFKNFEISFNPLYFIYILLVLVIASLLISGLAITLTAFAKSVKEGQSKTQTLTLITMIPMFLNLANVDLGSYFYMIPVVNYVQILMDIFNNVDISFVNIVITVVSSFVYCYIIIKAIVKQYKSEKVLFMN